MTKIYLRQFLFILTITIWSCSTGNETPDPEPEPGKEQPIQVNETVSAPAQTMNIYKDSTALIFNLGTNNAFNIYLSAQKGAVGIPVKLVFKGDDPSQNIKSLDELTSYYMGNVDKITHKVTLKNANFGYSLKSKNNSPVITDIDKTKSFNELVISSMLLESIRLETDNEDLSRKLYAMWYNEDFLSKVVITKVESKGISGQIVVGGTTYTFNK